MEYWSDGKLLHYPTTPLIECVPKQSRQTELPIDSPERRRLPILLRRAWYGLNQAFRRHIAHLEITPDQFTALRTLLEHETEGLVQSELTKLMASDPNTIASLVERMENAGLIQRRTDQTDRRANRIRLKPLGREKYEEARKIAVDLQGNILSTLPENKREEFLTNLPQCCGEFAETELKFFLQECRRCKDCAGSRAFAGDKSRSRQGGDKSRTPRRLCESAYLLTSRQTSSSRLRR
jgi:MarR family transcriptional regulator, transcriptional regulator for hemolysin